MLPGVAAQAQTLHRTECPLGYDQYIGRVWRENLSYAAEKLNVRIADAEVKAAGVFNDPQFGVEYGNNADRRMQMGQSVSAELSKTFSPGKRAARIDLARSEQELSGALLEDYFRNLRAEATLAYLDAVKQAELFRVKQDAYENIRKLAEGDSVKYTLGKITRVDDIQSGLEAGMMYNELLQARTDLHNAFFALNLQTATFDRDTLYVPSGSLHMPERTFDPDRLVQSALDNRADLAAALKDTEVARRALTVARRERNMDFDVSLGVNHNTEVRNEIAPAPRFQRRYGGAFRTAEIFEPKQRYRAGGQVPDPTGRSPLPAGRIGGADRSVAKPAAVPFAGRTGQTLRNGVAGESQIGHRR